MQLQRQNATLSIRLHLHELKSIKKAAKRAKMTVAEFVRMKTIGK